MSNIIDGFKVNVSSAEVKALLLEQADETKGKAKAMSDLIFECRNKPFEDSDIERGAAEIGFNARTPREAARIQKQLAQEEARLRWMANHIVEGATYRLSMLEMDELHARPRVMPMLPMMPFG